MVQNALFAHVRWPLISEVYEVAQAPYLAIQIFKTILRPRAAKFAVTAKDETLAEDFISPIYLPLLLLFLLMVRGCGRGGHPLGRLPGRSGRDRHRRGLGGVQHAPRRARAQIRGRETAASRGCPRVQMEVDAAALEAECRRQRTGAACHDRGRVNQLA